MLVSAVRIHSCSGSLKWLGAFLLPLVLAVPQSARTVQGDVSRCGHSTVEDAWGKEVASQAQLFLAKLQRVVKADDKIQFAKLVHYPVLIVDGGHRTEISSVSAMERSYSSIITTGVRRAILDQSPPCLFANDEGIMVGRGQVWFRKESDGGMKIITLNLTAPTVAPRTEQ